MVKGHSAGPPAVWLVPWMLRLLSGIGPQASRMPSSHSMAWRTSRGAVDADIGVSEPAFEQTWDGDWVSWDHAGPADWQDAAWAGRAVDTWPEAAG